MIEEAKVKLKLDGSELYSNYPYCDDYDTIKIYDNHSFESILKNIGQIFYIDIRTPSYRWVKSNLEDSDEFWVTAHKEYWVLVKQIGLADIGYDETSSSDVGEAFLAYVMVSISNLENTALLDKRKLILDNVQNDIKDYKIIYDGLTEDVKKIFDKWSGLTSDKEEIFEDYAETRNKYFADTPELGEKFKLSQDVLAERYKSKTRLNDAQINLLVQLLTHYIASYGKHTIENTNSRKHFIIENFKSLRPKLRVYDKQAKKVEGVLGRIGYILSFVWDMCLFWGFVWGLLWCVWNGIGTSIYDKFYNGFIVSRDFEDDQSDIVNQLKTSNSKAHLVEFAFSSFDSNRYGYKQLVDLGIAGIKNRTRVHGFMVLGVKRIVCRNGVLKIEAVVKSVDGYDYETLAKINDRFLRKCIDNKVYMPEDTISLITDNQVLSQYSLADRPLLSKYSLADNTYYKVKFTKKASSYTNEYVVVGSLDDIADAVTERGYSFKKVEEIVDLMHIGEIYCKLGRYETLIIDVMEVCSEGSYEEIIKSRENKIKECLAKKDPFYDHVEP